MQDVEELKLTRQAKTPPWCAAMMRRRCRRKAPFLNYTSNMNFLFVHCRRAFKKLKQSRVLYQRNSAFYWKDVIFQLSFSILWARLSLLQHLLLLSDNSLSRWFFNIFTKYVSDLIFFYFLDSFGVFSFYFEFHALILLLLLPRTQFL